MYAYQSITRGPIAYRPIGLCPVCLFDAFVYGKPINDFRLPELIYSCYAKII